jgi:hypothetical protein
MRDLRRPRAGTVVAAPEETVLVDRATANRRTHGGTCLMKKFALPLALVFATATFAAAQAPADAAKPAETKAPEARKPSKTHKVEAEIVVADVEKKSVTFKTAAGEKSAPVGALAMYRLKKVKAGDKVTLTCKDGASPEECAEVSFIKVAEAPAATAPEAPKQ